MIEAGSIEYAFARISSRLGDRPDEALWRRIAIVRDYASVLASVRASPLAPWVVGIGPDSDTHAIEAAARRHWRRLVAEVAAWMPDAWRISLLWCGVLADLPVLRHLAHREPRALWLRDDPSYGNLADPAAGAADRDLAALVGEGTGDARRLLAAWRARWERALPHPLPRDEALARLVRLLEDHARQFAGIHPADGWALRRALGARLTLLLRRAPVEPVGAFAFLALSALEYERLRAELVSRARSRAGRSPHDPPAARTLVRDPRRARRCDAGARSAGAHRRGGARGAPDSVLPASLADSGRAAAIRRACRCAITRTGQTIDWHASAFPEAPGENARPLPRARARVGAGRRTGDPQLQRRNESERAELVRWRRVFDALAAELDRLRAHRDGGTAGARAPVRLSARYRADRFRRGSCCASSSRTANCTRWPSAPSTS